MKTKLKAIICAAAAALSVAVGSTVAGAVSARSEKEAAYDAAVALRGDPEWIENFQLALLEGKSPTDPVHAAIFGLDMNEENDEVMPAYLEQATPASMDATKIELTLVHDDEGDNSYNLWSGRFVVADVKTFANTFEEPLTMKCDLLGTTTGTLINKKGFSVN